MDITHNSKHEKKKEANQVIKNERGLALPLMIAITFIAAYLLLMLATQLEIKVASYARTRTHLIMNLLELEGLEKIEHFLSTANIDSDFTKTFTLRNKDIITVNATKREYCFAFRYEIVYNGYKRSQKAVFCLENGVTFLD